MTLQEQLNDCKETLTQLVGKKVKDVDFKSSEECWRIYIYTDQGKIVMSYCHGWVCPAIEHRRPKPIESDK